mgnify:CR=1 FL=1
MNLTERKENLRQHSAYKDNRLVIDASILSSTSLMTLALIVVGLVLFFALSGIFGMFSLLSFPLCGITWVPFRRYILLKAEKEHVAFDIADINLFESYIRETNKASINTKKIYDIE